ncbi:hypothetical protein EVAR_89814_1 [Eumeta japonica]|uniref:Uncharacterized protein n=1 Tax=Eumeta variegata TaxID=151549 RepID=A0A4C1YJW0_EUMVA|nr:hypothetical protein EVAR_89814_1 [Eumeta japonica]
MRHLEWNGAMSRALRNTRETDKLISTNETNYQRPDNNRECDIAAYFYVHRAAQLREKCAITTQVVERERIVSVFSKRVQPWARGNLSRSFNLHQIKTYILLHVSTESNRRKRARAHDGDSDKRSIESNKKGNTGWRLYIFFLGILLVRNSNCVIRVEGTANATARNRRRRGRIPTERPKHAAGPAARAAAGRRAAQETK